MGIVVWLLLSTVVVTATVLAFAGIQALPLLAAILWQACLAQIVVGLLWMVAHHTVLNGFDPDGLQEIRQGFMCGYACLFAFLCVRQYIQQRKGSRGRSDWTSMISSPQFENFARQTTSPHGPELANYAGRSPPDCKPQHGPEICAEKDNIRIHEQSSHGAKPTLTAEPACDGAQSQRGPRKSKESCESSGHIQVLSDCCIECLQGELEVLRKKLGAVEDRTPVRIQNTVSPIVPTAAQQPCSIDHGDELQKRLRLRSPIRSLIVARFRGIQDHERGVNAELRVRREVQRDADLVHIAGGLDSRKTFRLDAVFTPSDSDTTVSTYFEQVIGSSIGERNIYLLADGQTGAGKSWTMFDSEHSIFKKTAGLLFDSTKLGDRPDIQLSVLEIYEGCITDLPSGKALRQISPAGLGRLRTKTTYRSASTLLSAARRLAALRRKDSTLKNCQSSRSHLIFCLHVAISDQAWTNGRTWELTIADLAGAEQLGEGTDRGGGKETIRINAERTGLFDFLGGSGSVRDSWLTTVLSDIKPNSPSDAAPTLVWLAQIRPFAEDLPKSIATIERGINCIEKAASRSSEISADGPFHSLASRL